MNFKLSLDFFSNEKHRARRTRCFSKLKTLSAASEFGEDVTYLYEDIDRGATRKLLHLCPFLLEMSDVIVDPWSSG